MQAEHYFGTYARFDTLSKKDAATLLGADNLVGDVYEIVLKIEQGTSIAWMKNRFGLLVGFFDASFSRELNILEARGWILQALLSYVAFTDKPEPGLYWGEAAVICFDPDLQHLYVPFVNSISQRLADGVRPEIDLGEQGVAQIVSSEGTWIPKKTVPFPKKEPGTVLMKSRRKMSEKLIEQGRKGSPGCYALSCLFLLLLLGCLAFLVLTFSGII